MEKQALLPKMPDFTWAKEVAEKALVQLSEFRAEVDSSLLAISQKAESLFWGGFWHGFITSAVLILVIHTFSRRQTK